MEPKELLEKLTELWTGFVMDADKALKGNKSAGMRSRKVSSRMTSLFKEWRKIKT